MKEKKNGKNRLRKNKKVKVKKEEKETKKYEKSKLVRANFVQEKIQNEEQKIREV